MLKVLVVDDEIENLRALERTLRREFEIHSTTSPEEALRLIEANEFAVIVSDQKMPGMSGTDLLRIAAQKSPLTTRIILTAFTEAKDILDSINRAEIYRYVTKPWDNEELCAIVRQAGERYSLLVNNQRLIAELEERNRTLERKEKELEEQVRKRTAELQLANEQLSTLAITDPLTSVLNRRGFLSRLQDEVLRSERYNHSLVLVMLDVDHFKIFNDVEGHVYGDLALKKIVELLSSNLRKTDSLGRFGGEEFIILMPMTDGKNAQEICERLRASVEQFAFEGKSGPAKLSISLGLASYPAHGKSPDDLILSADQALYVAKNSGRNRIVYAPQVSVS